MERAEGGAPPAGRTAGVGEGGARRCSKRRPTRTPFRPTVGRPRSFEVHAEVLNHRGVGAKGGQEVGIREGRASRRAGAGLGLGEVVWSGDVGIGDGVGVRLGVGLKARGVHTGKERGVE